MEDEHFLTEQIITYLGNKRTLLPYIGEVVKRILKELGKNKIDIVDVFSGSGIVSRYFKQFSNNLYTNDLEDYCKTLNTCYLSNKTGIDLSKLNTIYSEIINGSLIDNGFIYKLYAPKDDNNIQLGERCFYTSRNAKYLDTIRQKLENIEEPYKTLLLAPLIYEASVHTNTSGIFKGFYKNSETGIGQFGGNGRNALQRIMGNIELKMPVFSNYECNVNILQNNANDLYKILPTVDLAYMDPPYNQHPYGSNYFMLNLINSYKEPKNISKVSGIPEDWNKSAYNKKAESKKSMEDLCGNLKAKYLLISFNSEGFISLEEMTNMLNKIGKVDVIEINYNTFRGSRNLANRNKYVKEFLYLVKKY